MAVALEEIAADPVPGADGPAGPLPASALGVKPESDEYAAIVKNVKAQVESFLDAIGGYGPLLKLAAIRLFSAEAVLTRARTGSFRDPSGASMSLSSSDLEQWRTIREDAAKQIEKLAPQVNSKPSAITFAEVAIQEQQGTNGGT